MKRLGADKSYRDECGEYVCDGVKLLGEALRWGADIREVLWADEPELELEGVRQYLAPRELLDYVSPLKNCPGVISSVGMRAWDREKPGRTLVLETLQDPGNVGTILRTANALNMDTVILTGSCADIYNPKAVRAAMGALFRQRVFRMTLPEMREYLTEYGMRLYGAALSEKCVDIRKLELKNSAVAIGSEGRGLSSEFLSLCDGELIIPMNEQCESLNAAVAASIVMWELTR